MKWENTPQGNFICDGDGFYVSYNLSENVVGAEGTNGETALVFKTAGEKTFWILKGDWRKGYEPVIPQGLEAAKAFYKKNIEHRSKWSEDQKYVPTPSEIIEILGSAYKH